MISYLRKETVMAANQIVTSSYGQAHVVQQEANLDHYLEQVRNYGESVGSEEGRILRKAAHLLYHLTFDAHVFMDGNKRTAYLSVAWFLFDNGYQITLPPDDQDEGILLMREIAEGRRSISSICRWLGRFAVKTKKDDAAQRIE